MCGDGGSSKEAQRRLQAGAAARGKEEVARRHREGCRQEQQHGGRRK